MQVELDGETVWLAQAQLAELFQTTQQNISLHLQNIYAEGELQLPATHKESLSVHWFKEAQNIRLGLRGEQAVAEPSARSRTILSALILASPNVLKLRVRRFPAA